MHKTFSRSDLPAPTRLLVGAGLDEVRARFTHRGTAPVSGFATSRIVHKGAVRNSRARSQDRAWNLLLEARRNILSLGTFGRIGRRRMSSGILQA